MKIGSFVQQNDDYIIDWEDKDWQYVIRSKSYKKAELYALLYEDLYKQDLKLNIDLTQNSFPYEYSDLIDFMNLLNNKFDQKNFNILSSIISASVSQ